MICGELITYLGELWEETTRDFGTKTEMTVMEIKDIIESSEEETIITTRGITKKTTNLMTWTKNLITYMGFIMENIIGLNERLLRKKKKNHQKHQLKNHGIVHNNNKNIS